MDVAAIEGLDPYSQFAPLFEFLNRLIPRNFRTFAAALETRLIAMKTKLFPVVAASSTSLE
jgi:hypothetical protein